jgi:hypothetical protein
MSFWDEVRKIADGIVEFFKSGKAEELLGAALQVAAIVIKVVAMFNDAPPKERRPQVARDIMKFIKYAPDGVLEGIESLKRKGRLDKMTSADMDRVLGLATGEFIDAKNKEEGKA